LLPGSREIQRAVGEFAAASSGARRGTVHEEANFSLNLSIALAKLGRFEQADQELTRARALFGERGHSRGKVQTRLVSGASSHPRDLRGADSHIRGALSEAEEHGFEREHVTPWNTWETSASISSTISPPSSGTTRPSFWPRDSRPRGSDPRAVPANRRGARADRRAQSRARHLRAGLRIARRINDRFEEAATCRVMAMAHQILGNRERALRAAREGAQLLRKLERCTS